MKALKFGYLTTIAMAVALFQPTAVATEVAQEPLRFFRPSDGFKPAQPNLTNACLQLASSLVHLGSPVPYIRHSQAENQRITSAYRSKFGKDPANRFPDHLSDAYVDQLAKNWAILSPKLGLEEFSKEVGHCLHNAIRGTNDSGTDLVRVFNEHQAAVAEQMASSAPESIGFEQLRLALIDRFSLDESDYDYGTTLAFRDAVSYCHILQGVFRNKFRILRDGLSPADSEQLCDILQGVFMDAAMLAHLEFQLAIREISLK